MGIHAQFALANRTAIEAEIERLIGLLDAADAPAEDLEPEDDYCPAGDDGCGMVWSIAGGFVWGSADQEPGVLIPRYGDDQSRGPVNFNQAHDEYWARRKALGQHDKRLDPATREFSEGILVRMALAVLAMVLAGVAWR